MPQPIIAQDATLRQFAESFAPVFSFPQWKYFVTVLLGLIHCDAAHTLTGLLRHVAVDLTLTGLSRFLTHAPWSVAALTTLRQKHFEARLAPLVDHAHAQQRANRPRRPGRPTETVVTGFLILDDSTHVKRFAQHMDGLGHHYSATDHRPMPGHSLFQCLYVLWGQHLVLTPQMYRQRSVCLKEAVPFKSKVDLAVETITAFEPPPHTQTHVLVDSWYTCRRVWRTARQRRWDITGGLKSNRRLRLVAPDGGRSWMALSAFAATLKPEAFQAVVWPNQEGGEVVYAYMIRTWVRKLGPCQVLMVKPTAEASVSQMRFWATSRLEDTLQQVITVVAQRWDIEVFFADFKEILGSDQYQVRSAQAIVRFWALGACLYQYLDEQRVQLEQERGRHVTLGEVRAWLRDRHADLLLDRIGQWFQVGESTEHIHQRLRSPVA